MAIPNQQADGNLALEQAYGQYAQMQSPYAPPVLGGLGGYAGGTNQLGLDNYYRQWLAQQQIAAPTQQARPPAVVKTRSITPLEISIARRARAWRRLLRVIHWMVSL